MAATSKEPMASTKPVASVTEKEIHRIERQDTFFPWIARPEDAPRFNKASFPTQGVVGLVGACLTIVCSWGLLFAIRDTQQWQDKWPQVSKIFTPAALLSAIISVTSIFLHMAFNSGASIAWWTNAVNERATVGKLHDAWLYSSGVLGALRAGRRFNYIALATVFVASIPINGVLLQGALSVQSVPIYLPSSGVKLPFSSDFRANFSGYLDGDGNLNGINTRFSSQTYQYFSRQNRAQIVIDTNVTTVSRQNPSYIYALSAAASGCRGTCAFTSLGVGLQMDCSKPVTPRTYDFSVDESKPLWRLLPVVTDGLPIYNVKFDWDARTPNVIQFNLISKPESACSGVYKQLSCSLTAMQTKYSTLIQNNQTIAVGQSATLLSMPQRSEFDNSSFVAPIAVADESASRSTKIGYLAKVFNDVFGNSINLKYTNNDGVAQYGLVESDVYANAPWIVYGENATGSYDDTLDIASKGLDGCQARIDDDLDPLENDRDVIMNAIHRFMFYLSYRDGNIQAWYANATVPTFSPATDLVYQNWYRVVWWHWGASVGITLLIVLCITPTFWGFWHLSRTPTMSPLETARAFHAPVLADQNPSLDTEEILRQVHRRSIYPTASNMTLNESKFSGKEVA